MANENSYDQDPSKPVVFGGVVFPEDFSSTSNLSYTLRLTRTSLPSTGDVSSQSYEDLSLTFFIYVFLLPLLFLEIYATFVFCKIWAIKKRKNFFQRKMVIAEASPRFAACILTSNSWFLLLGCQTGQVCQTFIEDWDISFHYLYLQFLLHLL